jgi:cytoskeletal protein CcmA (bactofilin family)
MSMADQERSIHVPESFGKASQVGPALLIDGEISGREDLVVQGHVKGKINLPENDLLVAENGRVEAEIQVRNIIVKGEVSGNITALTRISIESSGRVKGDLAASLISIEDGAQYRGSVKVSK